MQKLSIAAAFLLAGLATQSLAAAGSDIGRVKVASGIASILRSGQTIAATPGLALQKGDILTTGKNGRIGATFYDNSRFAAGPNSRVVINEFLFDDTTHDGKFVTQVDRGSLAIISGQIAKKNKDAMRVRTPTALLGVRGTRFVVEVKGS
ncbi:MAG: FecR domain-containing protein [Pseudomonadota bacterium]